MKVPHLLVSAAAAAMLFAASAAEAQLRPIGGGPRNHFPAKGDGMHGKNRFFLPFVWVEQQDPVIIEKTVVKEVPVAVKDPPPPPPKREPYAVGKTYDTLPSSGCMKLIENGGSYYLCSGEWYQEVGGKYKAVAKH